MSPNKARFLKEIRTISREDASYFSKREVAVRILGFRNGTRSIASENRVVNLVKPRIPVLHRFSLRINLTCVHQRHMRCSLRRTAGSCPPCCVCASDIISCSGHNLSMLPSDLPRYATRLDLSHNRLTTLPVDWIVQPFDRLTVLVLSWNSISQTDSDSFTLTPHLLHLDLSSNLLAVLNSSIFHGLQELEELLLFGNQIVQINQGAFRDLRRLQKLYLSGNRLTSFPLELYKEPRGPHNLTFLDLSFNQLSQLPVQSLLSLPNHQQGGIYLQGNPLACDCALVAMLEYWVRKQYRPLVDFRGDSPCRLGTDGAGPDIKCRSRKQRVSDNYLKAGTHQVEPGDWLRVPCPGLAFPVQEDLVLFWVTPKMVLNSSADDPSDHLVVWPNGTLEIQGALLGDSGTYSCVAARGLHYNPSKPLEVRVVVGNLSITSTGGLAHSGTEHFNTAFTTLASCVVSIILVLLYLYLTPCRCRESKGRASRGCGGQATIICLDPREVDSEQRRSNGKRVAFLELQADDSNIRGPKAPMINVGHVATEGILKNGSRTVGQTLTDAAHIA
ncbi:hypothetical protein LDENG_00176160 [Lucifuga dentata]|nr:hypothetical protein LDENG_00176160 [Lucifuga dentata]